MLCKTIKAVALSLVSFAVSSLNATQIAITGPHYLSPSDFGANGEDKIDDTEAFQKCINEAKKKRVSRIVVAPGTYYIGKTIRLEQVSNMIIEGSGAVLVKPSGNNSNIFYIIPKSRLEIWFLRGIVFRSFKSIGLKK